MKIKGNNVLAMSNIPTFLQRALTFHRSQSFYLFNFLG